jgi:NTE family protein
MPGTGPGKTAFVLAGGGSFGAIQVGMLRELVKSDVRADFVVGCSVGAINGVHFAGSPDAAGVDALERIWRGLRRQDIFPVTLKSVFAGLLRRAHLVDPSGLAALLERHLRIRSLEEAAIPVHVVATSLLAGVAVCFSRGPAIPAILASAAIPAAFPPVRIGDEDYIDGGVASNTPIETARALGATRVVVLPGGFSCALAAPPRGAVASAMHALNLMIARQMVSDIERIGDAVDIAVVPPLCPVDVSPYDFTRAGELIDRAAKSTRGWLDGGGLARREIPHQLRIHGHHRVQP